MNGAIAALAALVLTALPHAAQAQAQQPQAGTQQPPQQQQQQTQQSQQQQTQQQQEQTQQPMQQPQVAVEQEIEPLSVDQVDAHFVWVAVQAGLGELQLSQLAARQAMRQDVVDFGQTMVQHHTELNQQLAQLAQQLGVETPQEPSPEQMLNLTVLASTAGEEFDALYASGQARHHEETVQLYRFVAQNGLEEEVRTFAENTLPTLEQHLEVARVLAQ